MRPLTICGAYFVWVKSRPRECGSLPHRLLISTAKRMKCARERWRTSSVTRPRRYENLLKLQGKKNFFTIYYIIYLLMARAQLAHVSPRLYTRFLSESCCVSDVIIQKLSKVSNFLSRPHTSFAHEIVTSTESARIPPNRILCIIVQAK